jgi:hypothetical protein
MSSLPAHAPMVTLLCEAAGTGFPERKQYSEGAGSDGMVKTTELPLTYRHARKCENC